MTDTGRLMIETDRRNIADAFPGVDTFRSEKVYTEFERKPLNKEKLADLRNWNHVHQLETCLYLKKSLPVFRFAIGELIPITDRKIYPIDPVSHRNKEYSGSMGFVDFALGAEDIPLPLANIKQGRAVSLESKQCLHILTMGVEPEYQRQGLGHILIELCEEHAPKKGLDAVVLHETLHPESQNLVFAHGYVNYRGWERAAKLLKEPSTSLSPVRQLSPPHLLPTVGWPFYNPQSRQ